MGCDIHAYVEYQRWPSLERPWTVICHDVGSRDYRWFGIIAGVRVDDIQQVPMRGLPQGISDNLVREAYLRVEVGDEATADNTCTVDDAVRWKIPREKWISLYNEDYVPHPDWHSHSWMTAAELDACILRYNMMFGDDLDAEWLAVAALMQVFEDRGTPTRLVFWFDN